MNLRTGDSWGYWALVACGLLFFLAGMTNTMGGSPISELPIGSALLALVGLGVPVVALLVLLRNRNR